MISIHAPSRERRPALSPSASSADFNPRFLAGATAKFTYTIYAAIFQSSLCVSDNRHYVISILAPLQERPSAARAYLSKHKLFNPRSLAGATHFFALRL